MLNGIGTALEDSTVDPLSLPFSFCNYKPRISCYVFVSDVLAPLSTAERLSVVFRM